MNIVHLTCNRTVNPMGLDTSDIFFSYHILDEKNGVSQKQYRIIVSKKIEDVRCGCGSVWDSGIVEEEQQAQITYEGEPLESRTRYYWKVSVTNNYNETAESEISFFETAILYPDTLSGNWITKDILEVLSNDREGYGLPAAYFRKEFEIIKPIKRARAYICGLGYHHITINGQALTDTMLNPGFTQYDLTALYNTYEAETALRQGKNCIGIILGDGWYNQFIRDNWLYKYAAWRDTPKFLLNLEIMFEDGEIQNIESDTEFRVSADGPIRYNAVRNGEHYDARMELAGWNMPGYDDSGWSLANITKAPGGKLKSQIMPPIRIVRRLKPVVWKKNRLDRYFADFGENLAGVCNVTVKGRAGTEIVIRYSERVSEEDSFIVDSSSLSCYTFEGEFQTDKYILKGGEAESWHGIFTYHGFRYAEVEILNGTVDEISLEALEIHTDLTSRSDFGCSDEILNKIWIAGRKSMLSNYHSIPTDCPHREKNGWTGDAQISGEQALFNFDIGPAYTKWLEDFEDAQRPSGQIPGVIPSSGWGYNWGSGPAWDSALILLPWYMYLYDADIHILKRMYPCMKKYMMFMKSMSNHGLVQYGLGDWCAPTHDGADNLPCDVMLTDTAYYFSNSVIMEKVAALLGFTDDERLFKGMAEESRRAFRDKYFELASNGMAEGMRKEGQTELACALYQGLTKEDETELFKEKLMEQIRKWDFHFDTGILGTKYLVNVDGSQKFEDMVYRMITNRTCPSYRYMMDQGATTIWEVWRGTTSLNHHMFTSVLEWFYKQLAGIQLDELKPGYKHIMIHPALISQLTYAFASHESPYGTVKCRWERQADGGVVYDISVPVGCSATLFLPIEDEKEFWQKNPFLSEADRDNCGGIVIPSGQYRLYA